MSHAPDEFPERSFEMGLGKLDVHDGDLVVLRLTDELMEHSDVLSGAFRAMLNDQGLSNCVLVVMRPGVELTAFDEDAMRRLGWVRARVE